MADKQSKPPLSFLPKFTPPSLPTPPKDGPLPASPTQKRPDVPIQTPFGRIHFPQPELPPINLKPEIDERRRQALSHAVAIDGTKLLALVPVIGDQLAETITDFHRAEVNSILTKEENAELNKYNKPSPFMTIAILRSFIKT